jgi:nucleoid-associated protein YgaU
MGRTVICITVVALTVGGYMVGGLARADLPAQPVRLPISLSSASIDETVVVRPGDHLWKISERRLDEVLSRDPTDADVSPYWREVIEANRSRLRSGDPDLIYPGEQVEMPPVEMPPANR